MDFDKAFATDDKLEQEGRWFPLGEGASCKIARTGNTRYKEMLRAKMGVYEASLQARLLDDDTGDAVLIEVMAKTILLGWEGWTDEGKEVVYSVATAIEKNNRGIVKTRELPAKSVKVNPNSLDVWAINFANSTSSSK